MKRSDLNLLVAIVMCIGGGLFGIWAGWFGTTTECSATCTTHHAGTISPLPLLVGVLFLAVGVYLLVRMVRMFGEANPASSGARGANDRVDLARHVREFYLAPENQLVDSASPSEFDRRMLDLLDAIEGGTANIDALIDAARSYTRQQGWRKSGRDRMKARRLWECGATYLQWGPSRENWQLRRNWNRMLRIAGWMYGADVTIPRRWIERAPVSLTTGLGKTDAAQPPSPTI